MPQRDRREIGGATAVGYVRVRSLTEGECVAWVLRLVEIGAEGEGPCADVVEISRPDSLDDIADLGLTLADARLVLAGVQREIVAAQARVHAVHRPVCRSCGAACRMKDYRQHAIATLFGPVTVRLPRFRCAGCGTTEAGMAWPPYCPLDPGVGSAAGAALYSADLPDGGRPARADVPGGRRSGPGDVAPPYLQGRRGAADASGRQTGHAGRDDHADLGLDVHPQL